MAQAQVEDREFSRLPALGACDEFVWESALANPEFRLSLMDGVAIGTFLAGEYPEVITIAQATQGYNERIDTAFNEGRDRALGSSSRRDYDRTADRLNKLVKDDRRRTTALNAIAASREIEASGIEDLFVDLAERITARLGTVFNYHDGQAENVRDGLYHQYMAGLTEETVALRDRSALMRDLAHAINARFQQLPPMEQADQLIGAMFAVAAPAEKSEEAEIAPAEAAKLFLASLSITNESHPLLRLEKNLHEETAKHALTSIFIAKAGEAARNLQVDEQIRLLEAFSPGIEKSELESRLAAIFDSWTPGMKSEYNNWLDSWRQACLAIAGKLDADYELLSPGIPAETALLQLELIYSKLIIHAIRKQKTTSARPNGRMLTSQINPIILAATGRTLSNLDKELDAIDTEVRLAKEAAETALAGSVALVPLAEQERARKREVISAAPGGNGAFTIKAGSQKDHFAAFGEVFRSDAKIMEDLEACKQFLAERLDFAAGIVRGIKRYEYHANIDGDACAAYAMKPVDVPGLPLHSKTMRQSRIVFALKNGGDDGKEHVVIIGVFRRDAVQKFEKTSGLLG